jgi:exosortase/archaeosortase family protein
VKVISTYKNKWQQIPLAIRKMLITGAILLGIWKSLYTFWLEPNRFLDAPLTNLVAAQTVDIMQLVWPEGNYSLEERSKAHKGDINATVEHLFIYKDTKKTISIADNCNGLELMVLYAAFIICMPGNWKRKTIFILLGIPLLHIANLGRCVGLVGMHLQWPGMFDFAHHYLFKIMVYAISFLLWVWYLKPITSHKNQDA